MKKIFILFFLLITTNVCFAEVKMNFTKDVFLKAQESGKTVVVNSWNKWCGTCIKQEKIIREAKVDFKNILFLSFAQKNKNIAEYLKIDHRSTIVIYKDNKEIARAIGITKKEDISEFQCTS